MQNLVTLRSKIGLNRRPPRGLGHTISAEFALCDSTACLRVQGVKFRRGSGVRFSHGSMQVDDKPTGKKEFTLPCMAQGRSTRIVSIKWIQTSRLSIKNFRT